MISSGKPRKVHMFTDKTKYPSPTEVTNTHGYRELMNLAIPVVHNSLINNYIDTSKNVHPRELIMNL